MATPATNRQVPDAAIMDFYNKQAYLGNQYIANTGVVALTGTTEVPLIYILNPAVSGTAAQNSVGLFLRQMRLVCDDASGVTNVLFRIYVGSSGVSGGTTVIPANCRLASNQASVATILISPTVTTKGTAINTLPTGWNNEVLSELMLIIDQGKGILITAQPSASSIGLALLSWYEI